MKIWKPSALGSAALVATAALAAFWPTAGNGLLKLKSAGQGSYERATYAETSFAGRAQTGEISDSHVRQPYSKNLGVDLKGLTEFVSVIGVEQKPLTPVSMTKIGPNQFLVVNYRHVFLFDTERKEATPVELDMPVPVWVPTAIQYSAFYDRVFIANYTGKDILVAEIVRNGAKVKLKLTERITHAEGIKGPEGVQVSPGGRFMAVADYDGAALSVFEQVNDAWVYRWKKPVVSSHGVAIVGNYVYGAGTTIAKFDLESGDEVARVSKIGERDILFATCISEDEESGDLIGTDAMTGQVFTMTTDLELKEAFGANGPTHVNLSMPFCAYRDGADIYVLSTYQDRIIQIGKSGTRSFEFGGPRWDYVSTPSAFRNSADVWRGPVKSDHPSHEMLGKTVRPSYGSLRTADGATLLMPARGDVPGSTWPYYVTTIASNEDSLAITANSSPVVLIYDRKNNSFGSIDIGEWDCWAVATSIVCPSRRYSVADLADKATALDRNGGEGHSEGHQASAVGKTIPLLDYWRASAAGENLNF